MKHIVLCADDYGQNKAISQAIILLLNKKRLSAVSCLTTSPQFLNEAKSLVSFDNQVDIGLHFNLTEGQPLTDVMAKERFQSWWKLLCKGAWGLLDRNAIAFELNAQLDCFAKGIGRPPDFIDGHQHIHQFPLIQEVLLEVYASRGLKCHIRSTYDHQILWKWYEKAYFKKSMIQFFLSTSFKMQLIRRKIPHNSSFSGIYDFSIKEPYRNYFRKFLSQSNDYGMIMCHPGLDESNETIAKARKKEFIYFASDEFLKDCEAQDIILTRLRG